MLNKICGVIYFHFNIFSEKTVKTWVLIFTVLSFKNVPQVGPFYTTVVFALIFSTA